MQIFSPVRISFFGGGTDLPFFYEKFGGKILSTTIDLGWHINFSPSKQKEILYKGEKSDLVQTAIRYFHPYPKGFTVRISKDRDLLGLGSSASLLVGLIRCLAEIKSKALTNREIAEAAWEIENNQLGLLTGKQDAYTCAYGGLRTFQFSKDDNVQTDEIILSEKTTKDLLSRLVLIYVGGTRPQEMLQKKLISALNDDKRLRALKKLKEDVDICVKYLQKGELDKFGQMLDSSWTEKKLSNPSVSTEKIDEIYDQALSAGALGGKLCGAGAAGYMVFFTKENRKSELIKTLEKYGCKYIPCNFYPKH